MRTNIARFSQSEKVASVLARELDATASTYNRHIVSAAQQLARTQRGHFEYITSTPKQTIWRNPSNDQRVSLEV